MPISGARYRFRRTSKGATRLAFVKNKVVEAKPYKRTRTGLKPIGPAKKLAKGGRVRKTTTVKGHQHMMSNGHMMKDSMMKGMH